MLKEILSDLVSAGGVLFVVKSGGATSEIRSDGLSVREREKYINIGDGDGPCHMHINTELIRRAEFVAEQKQPQRISFGVRFLDKDGERVLAGFFTGMYDENRRLKEDRRRLFDELSAKYGHKITF